MGKQKTSFVLQIENQAFTIIKSEYLELCCRLFKPHKLQQSARVGAALLNYFESQANKYNTIQEIKYVKASTEHLHKCIMGVGGQSSIKSAMKILIENNYILCDGKAGPQKTYFDNTKKYKLNVIELNNWLIEYRIELQSKNVVVEFKEPSVEFNQRVVEFNQSNSCIQPNINKDSLKNEKVFFEENQNLKNSEPNYIDFNELISHSNKVGIEAHIKALIQTHFNYDIFDDYDNGKIKSIINKIRLSLKIDNEKKGIYTKITNQNVLEAFKIGLQSFLDKVTDSTNYSLSYFDRCLTPNYYLNTNTTEQVNTDLEPYIKIIQSVFPHYGTPKRNEITDLKTIIKEIEKSGTKDCLMEFKFIMNNLPDYITSHRTIQSISYIKNKIGDLIRTCSLNAKVTNDPNYAAFAQSFSHERAFAVFSNKYLKQINLTN